MPDVDTFTQHVCRARPSDAGSSTGVGKGVFGDGCYVPVGPAEINIKLEVDVLVAPPGDACLQWKSLEDGDLPANTLRLEGTPVCQAHHNGVTVFGGKLSDGEHVGQLIQNGSEYTCVFGFYMDAVGEPSSSSAGRLLDVGFRPRTDATDGLEARVARVQVGPTGVRRSCARMSHPQRRA